MYTHRSAALEFALELSNPNFMIIRKKRYDSRSGWAGVRWEAELNGRLIYGSENRTTVPTPPSEQAKILMRYGCQIDQSKSGLILRAPQTRDGDANRIPLSWKVVRSMESGIVVGGLAGGAPLT
jgi:hypothetical protein